MQSLRAHLRFCPERKKTPKKRRAYSPPPTPLVEIEEKPAESIYESKPTGTLYPAVVQPVPQAFTASWQMHQAPPPYAVLPQPPQPPEEAHARLQQPQETLHPALPQAVQPIVIRVEGPSKEVPTKDDIRRMIEEAKAPPPKEAPKKVDSKAMLKQILEDRRKGEESLYGAAVRAFAETQERLAEAIEKATKKVSEPERVPVPGKPLEIAEAVPQTERPQTQTPPPQQPPAKTFEAPAQPPISDLIWEAKRTAAELAEKKVLEAKEKAEEKKQEKHPRGEKPQEEHPSEVPKELPEEPPVRLGILPIFRRRRFFEPMKRLSEYQKKLAKK